VYFSPNIIRVFKPRRIKLGENVPRTGERRGAYRVLVGQSEGKGTLEILGVDKSII
jgi:hypothetical protein